MLAVTIWYVGWARHYFKGPVRTVDLADPESEAAFGLAPAGD
jgi:hypothetical protein